MSKKLIIATYNIQFSQHPEEIISNLKTIVANGASILCLQEVYINEDNNIIQQLIDQLGKSWKAVCHLVKDNSILNMGNCILWNTKIVSKISSSLEILPYSKPLALHEKVFSLLVGGITSPFKRRIVLINFRMNKKNFCIANVHLDHNGGAINRLTQLAHIKKLLKKFSVSDKEILCGDFNCFDLSKNGIENEAYEKLLGSQYAEATKNIDWTGDLYDIDTSMGNIAFGKIIRLLNIHLQRKIDYIWLRNIQLVKCKKITMSGSDHKPVVAEIII